MDFLKINNLIWTILALISGMGCSQNFESVLSAPRAVDSVIIYGKSELDGAFSRPNGEQKFLSEFNGQPLLIFFVGEFCQVCLQETTHLKEMVLDKGLPTKIRFITIMLDGFKEDIIPWYDALGPQNFPNNLKWDLGVDTDRSLFSLYFTQFITPSIIYFDPQTQIIKRWQQAVSLQQLEQETQSWY